MSGDVALKSAARSSPCPRGEDRLTAGYPEPREKSTNERINAMTTDFALKAQEEILSRNVSDEALEVAAGGARINASFTLGSCTGLSECPG